MDYIADAGDHEITVERKFNVGFEDPSLEIIWFEIFTDEHGDVFAQIGLPALISMSEEGWKVVGIDRIKRKRKGTLATFLDSVVTRYPAKERGIEYERRRGKMRHFLRIS